MKKYLLSTVVVFGLAAFTSNVQAQDLNTMKKQRETLKTSLDLFDKEIELLSEKQNNEKKVELANSLNRKADKTSDGFSKSDNVKNVANNAKDAARALKKSESANKDVLKSNNKIVDLEADVRKLKLKLDAMEYRVEVTQK